MKEIVDFAREHGMLLHPSALNFFKQNENPLALLQEICSSNEHILFLEQTFIEDFLKRHRLAPSAQKVQGMPQDNVRAQVNERLRHQGSEEFDHQFKIEFDITGNSTCEGELSDFHQCFTDRYESLFKLLKRRQELGSTSFLNRIGWSQGEAAVIGIISNIRETSWGSTMVTIEDKSGSLILQLTNETERSEELLHDEVIGAVGTTSRDGKKLFVNEIIHPDIPFRGGTQHRASRNVAVAFLSDIHFGSTTFLKKDWQEFLSWINLDGDYSGEEKELVRTIKYIVIPGDLVDGIGIYPHQEKELEILDIYDQYLRAAKELSYIPGHIQIIIQPGNHDAVRLAEPQPALPGRIQELFKRKNIRFTGNPSEFLIEGVRILSYHGKSLNDFDKAVKDLKMMDPMPIMKSIMKRRHLAPIYGASTQLAPEHRDYLVIENIPDIFVTGHVHSAGYQAYKGVLLLNASCWQSQTDYQKMMNFFPTPSKVPVVNLQSFAVNMLDFSSNMATTEHTAS